jgi:hypothetical protein
VCPVAASTAPGQTWSRSGSTTRRLTGGGSSGISVEHLSPQRGLGQPALIAAPGRLDIFMRGFFMRGFGRAVHHIRKTSAGVLNQLMLATIA